MKIKNPKIFFHFTLSFCIFTFAFCIGGIAYAAEFRVESDATNLAVGDEFLIQVLVDTEGEQLNAFEGHVIFPRDLLELKSIREQGSIVSLWVSNPPNFSGLTPGGYEGEGVLFSLIFEAKAEGQGTITIEQGKTLLNDGEGTPAPLEIFNFQFSIFSQDTGTNPQTVTLDDTEPPEPFEIKIGQDPSIFSGQRFLAFSARDKNSGVDHYEISFVSNRRESVWAHAESPFLLADASDIQEIRVKAVDRAGNERIAVLSIPETQGSLSLGEFLVWGNLGILGGIGGVFCLWLWRKKNQKSKLKNQNER